MRLVGIQLLYCCSEVPLVGREISARIAPAQAEGTNRSGQTVSHSLRSSKSAPLLALRITRQQRRTTPDDF